tara:strand:+ start:17630 stop:18157 length:528 start_codon:yes stop_codon:yes gene_type:complete
MGFDVHGIKPKVNVELDDTTVYGMIESIDDFAERWSMQDNLNKNDRKKYWEQMEKHHDDNPGIYFRNNVWWWRPLWDYVCNECIDVLDKDDITAGHYNDGRVITKTKAMKIADILFKKIESGETDKYANHFEIKRKEAEKSDDKDINYKSSYPFNTDNVRRFAEFCKESGGFEIC